MKQTCRIGLSSCYRLIRLHTFCRAGNRVRACQLEPAQSLCPRSRFDNSTIDVFKDTMINGIGLITPRPPSWHSAPSSTRPRRSRNRANGSQREAAGRVQCIRVGFRLAAAIEHRAPLLIARRAGFPHYVEHYERAPTEACQLSRASQSAHARPRLASFASAVSAGRRQSAMVSSAPCRYDHIHPLWRRRGRLGMAPIIPMPKVTRESSEEGVEKE